MKHLTTEEIETGLDEIINSSKDNGVLKLIVCRPKEDEREVFAWNPSQPSGVFRLGVRMNDGVQQMFFEPTESNAGVVEVVSNV